MFELHFGDDLLSDIARRPVEAFTERHGKVCLIIAKLGILARTHHLQQFVRFFSQLDQGRPKSGFQFSKNVHAATVTALLERYGLGLAPQLFQRIKFPRFLLE